MQSRTKTGYFISAASATQTLPEAAARVVSVEGLAGAATSIAATNFPVVVGAPSAGQVQFTGTPGAPSTTLTFNSALTAAGLYLVTYVPAGDIAADI